MKRWSGWRVVCQNISWKISFRGWTPSVLPRIFPLNLLKIADNNCQLETPFTLHCMVVHNDTFLLQNDHQLGLPAPWSAHEPCLHTGISASASFQPSCLWPRTLHAKLLIKVVLKWAKNLKLKKRAAFTKSLRPQKKVRTTPLMDYAPPPG